MSDINNIQNEILFVGSLYKEPELLVSYSEFVRSKYDFDDEATKFFYDNAEIIYKTRSEKFNEVVVGSFMSEEPERLNKYVKYGGYKTIASWMKLSETENIKNYFEIVKKYSLLREYGRNGIDVTKIMSHKKFDSLSVKDVYRLVRGKVDKINTVISANNEAVILNKSMRSFAQSFLIKPDFGITLPFPIMTQLYRGCKLGTTMANAMLSNAGKTRFMVEVIAHIAFIEKQKCFVMINEMSEDELKLCLLTTVVNNEEYQMLHGIKIKKPERELSLGLYKDDNGEFIYRKVDDKGNYTETPEEYISRVYENSFEYRQIMKISEWIENEQQQYIYVKDVVSDYSDKSLEFEMRKAHTVNGCSYMFYDTCKNDKSTTDWGAFKLTVTHLTDVAKELNVFLFLSIQLTDDSIILKPDELTSLNISNCKSIKHVLYTLNLFKEVKQDEMHKYTYIQVDENYGTAECELKPNKRYYVCNIDKNRFGSKKKLLFGVDLDLNIWKELGELRRK